LNTGRISPEGWFLPDRCPDEGGKRCRDAFQLRLWPKAAQTDKALIYGRLAWISCGRGAGPAQGKSAIVMAGNNNTEIYTIIAAIYTVIGGQKWPHNGR
jgi:hypothetical protein